MRQLLALMGGIGKLRRLAYARESCLMGGSGTMGQQEGILMSPNLPSSRYVGSLYTLMAWDLTDHSERLISTTTSRLTSVSLKTPTSGLWRI